MLSLHLKPNSDAARGAELNLKGGRMQQSGVCRCVSVSSIPSFDTPFALPSSSFSFAISFCMLSIFLPLHCLCCISPFPILVATVGCVVEPLAWLAAGLCSLPRSHALSVFVLVRNQTFATRIRNTSVRTVEDTPSSPLTEEEERESRGGAAEEMERAIVMQAIRTCDGPRQT